MNDTSRRTRVTKGVPQGGEFATEAKAENADLIQESGIPSYEELAERALWAEAALLRVYDASEPEHRGSFNNDALGAVQYEAHNRAMDRIRAELDDPEIVAAIERQRARLNDATDRDALALLKAFGSESNASRRMQLSYQLKLLQESGYDITQGGTRAVIYPRALLRTGDVILQPLTDPSPRNRIDGVITDDLGYGGERTVLYRNGGIMAIRDRREGEPGVYYSMLPAADRPDNRVVLGRRDEEVPPEHECKAFIHDLDKADKALKPWVRTGTDSAGEEFSFIAPEAPIGLQAHYKSLMSHGYARGIL